MNTEWQSFLDNYPKRTELVFRGEYVACGFVYDSHRRGKEHHRCNEGYGLFYLMRGSGRYTDEYGSVDFHAGSVVQRFPGRQHHIRFRRGHQMFQMCMRLPPQAFELLHSANAIHLEQPVFEIGLRPELPHRMEGLMTELRSQPEQDLHQSTSRILQLMSDIHHSRHAPEGDNRLNSARSRLRDDLHQRIALESIAKELGMSYSNFRKYFRAQTGMAPGEYRIRCRIEQIQQQLVNSDETLSEIAADFGYPDLYSFSKQFKKFAGLAPRAFRDVHRGG